MLADQSVAANPEVPSSSPSRPASRGAPAGQGGHSTPGPLPGPGTKQSRRPCRFFNTSKGCRAGSTCPYRHDGPNKGPHSGEERPVLQETGYPAQRPVSQLQQSDPREFQLRQVVRRFSPVRHDADNGTTSLAFTLRPSDPDFPFELDGLQCTLKIPRAYPTAGRPAIRISNADMARGFQINIERGFDGLVDQFPSKTLLALLNDMDKALERFLTSEKAATIKIVANADRKIDPSEGRLQSTEAQASSRNSPPVSLGNPAPPPASPTASERAVAAAKRQADIRQLEARMGRVPNFAKFDDGTTFTIPVQFPKATKLPEPLRSVTHVTLNVPKLYNLDPCSVVLGMAGGLEAEWVQLAFETHVRTHPDLTLMAHINYLIQNIHTMASEPEQSRLKPEALTPAAEIHTTADVSGTLEHERDSEEWVLDADRPHVRVIPRPPEWDDHHESSSSSDSDSSLDSDGSADLNDEGDHTQADGGVSLPATSDAAEKGILLSFPNLELHNVELLSLASLSISVKCLRCKTPLDIASIKPCSSASPTAASALRTESCPKCTTPFTVTFVPLALHANSIRAATIEVTGCSIADLLPSVFQPTCASCSTTFPSPPGVVAVRGDTPIQVCRACHARMTFTIPEVKFLRLAHPSAALPLRKPKTQPLGAGISAGAPLPGNGTCQHYRHSYRWFRFGCCGRVYACDRCHDAAEAHVNDRAERMVCGWCSREQRFRPEDCGICGRSVMRRRKAAGGFWEGGKGTRDKSLMSRKEKRKYKRPPGTAPGKKTLTS